MFFKLLVKQYEQTYITIIMLNLKRTPSKTHAMTSMLMMWSYPQCVDEIEYDKKSLLEKRTYSHIAAQFHVHWNCLSEESPIRCCLLMSQSQLSAGPPSERLDRSWCTPFPRWLQMRSISYTYLAQSRTFRRLVRYGNKSVLGFDSIRLRALCIQTDPSLCMPPSIFSFANNIDNG